MVNKRTNLRVGILGCGNVGAALLRLLDSDSHRILARTGIGLEVSKVLVRDLDKSRNVSLTSANLSDILTNDSQAIVSNPDIDIVVELIGGVEPAYSLIETALKAGKPVVTANKELLSRKALKLVNISIENKVELLYEAAVGGAIPLVRALRESLAGERIEKVIGIVNGTTNYILTRMAEEGLDFEYALSQAQSLGFAEADPTADIEGYDAAGKAAILASIVFGQNITFDDVYREGIGKVRSQDVDIATKLGYVIKLLVIAEKLGDSRVAVRVHPAMLDKQHPLASVRGAFNAVFIEGASAGELMLYGQGAGGVPTASAVLGDLIDAGHHLQSGSFPSPDLTGLRKEAHIHPMETLSSQFYLNIDVLDQPGVLALVAKVFGDNKVSIRLMEQMGLGSEARLVFLTHKAVEKDVTATLSALESLDVVRRIGGVIRILGEEIV